MKPVVAIVGPTAVGKSKLALKLAQTFGGEIISADSRQVYRYMDIGTAKPGREERSLVPHHLIDVVDPDQDFSLALFQELAQQALEEVQGQGKIPFLVGGSGLYIWSFLEGWRPAQISPNRELRHSLEAKAHAEGADALYRELQRCDPVAAESIDSRNIRRVIRALEVFQATGVPFSRLQHKEQPPFTSIIIGLTTDRAELYRRIDSRVDGMIESGLVAEVERLVGRGYSFALPSMSGIGYQQIGMHLRGECDLATAVQKIKYQTHRLARHQYAWFRPSDQRIHWIDIKDEALVSPVVAEFLKS